MTLRLVTEPEGPTDEVEDLQAAVQALRRIERSSLLRKSQRRLVDEVADHIEGLHRAVEKESA